MVNHRHGNDSELTAEDPANLKAIDAAPADDKMQQVIN